MRAWVWSYRAVEAVNELLEGLLDIEFWPKWARRGYVLLLPASAPTHALLVVGLIVLRGGALALVKLIELWHAE